MYAQQREGVIQHETQENAETGQRREEVLAKSSCPKCGKALGRGAHFHIKACKG